MKMYEYEKREPINITISSTHKKQLQRMKEEGQIKSHSDFINYLLDKYFENKEKQK